MCGENSSRVVLPIRQSALGSGKLLRRSLKPAGTRLVSMSDYVIELASRQ